jgi:hypothetical protein
MNAAHKASLQTCFSPHNTNGYVRVSLRIAAATFAKEAPVLNRPPPQRSLCGPMTLRVLPIVIAMLAASCAAPSAPPAGAPDQPAPLGQAQCRAECRAVSECAPGKGHVTDATCGASYLVCCAPQGTCGGQEDFACCDSTAQFRPICRDGRLQCNAGQTRAPAGGCPGAAQQPQAGPEPVSTSDDGLERRAVDVNGDGRPDVVKYFAAGQLVREEIDLNFDGKPDVWSYYEGGRLVRKESDFDGDGKADKVERY